jgi:anaerobic selenocysteine-containing dehydrogenase
LVRNGPKGSGSFKEISWPEALDLLEQRLTSVIADHGAEAVLPYSYAGHMGLVNRNAGDAFFHKLGASRLNRTICSATAAAGYQASLGSGPTTDIESVVDSDLIIIWGNNTLSTNVHAWPFFQKARRQGAQIVVIDPYRNRTAKKADRHLMLRPGTDAALALSMMHVLISEDLVDQDYISRYTQGFEQLKERVQQYPPVKAQEITGVPAADIQQLAREFGRAQAPFIRTGWGPARQIKGAMAMRTIVLLPALVGAFAKKGGGLGRSIGPAFPLNTSRLVRQDLAPPDVRTINMVELGNGLTKLSDPPVKFLYVYLSNPAAVAPDSSRVLAGLAREDLFTVVQEMFLTETASFADLVLPGSCSMEMTDIYAAYGHYYLQMAHPVIPAPGQCRSILSVFQELAQRFGFDEEVFQASEDQIISWLLDSPSPYLEGMTFERLNQCRPLRVNAPANPYADGFPTASGKVEFFSQALADMGLDPLPDGGPSQDEPGLGSYPLQLITPPCHQFLNSTFNEVDSLLEQAGPACVLMHEDDARVRDIEDGDQVRVYNGRGECLLRAKVEKDTLPGVTVAEGLYWGRHTPGGKGVNHLTSQRLADLGGSNAFHCNLVEIEAAS